MATEKSILILGGMRSGKSTYAEELAKQQPGCRTYIATAQAQDQEMSERIATHVKRRGTAWQTVEEPLELARAISENSAPDTFLLVDCITLWLTNIILDGRNVDEETAALIRSVSDARGTLVLVSNEVGQGIVPENALARRFCNEAGILNQKLARAAGSVVLVTAGMPLTIK